VKFLVGLFLVLFAATAAALLLLSDAGYVLIAVGNWTVEMSLAVLVVLVLIAFALLYYTLRLTGGAVRLPQRWRGWRERRRSLKAQRGLTEGLLAFAEGDWTQAERDARLAIGLTQAELQLEHRQLEQAESTLTQLQRKAPRHRQVLKLQMRLLLELNDWLRLRNLLPELRRRKVIPANEYTVLELKVYGELLDAAAVDGDADALVAVWQRVPKDLRAGELLVLTYVRHLIRFDRGSLAEPLLRETLNRRMSDRLAHLYGLVEGSNPARQLEAAESWLAGDPRNPALLLTVGRLALRTKLWGKARGALEGSLAVQPSVETQRELGALLEHLGEHEAAATCYREAARLAAEAANHLAMGSGTVGAMRLPSQDSAEGELLRAAGSQPV